MSSFQLVWYQILKVHFPTDFPRDARGAPESHVSSESRTARVFLSRVCLSPKFGNTRSQIVETVVVP